MYLPFFGLNEKPFAITPDPRYLFLGERHSEALAHLVYGISEAGGFIQLTGEVGTGKTTIIRSLLAQAPANAEVALILNPRISAPEFLLTICEELGIGVPDSAVGSVKDLVDILNRFLLKAHADGRRVVLVVDEAQNLAPDVMEQVRLLTNLETATQKLLQIILIGQPELRDMLARVELRQLAQRMTARYHLAPLNVAETRAYVGHRLRVAGATHEIFSRGALQELHRRSGGIPRLINIIGDRALLGAYTQERPTINAALVRQAAAEVFGRRFWPAWLPWVAVAALATITVAGLLWLRPGSGTSLASSAAAAPPPPDAAVDVAAPKPAALPTAQANTGSSIVPRDLPLMSLLAANSGETGTARASAKLLGLWGVAGRTGDPNLCAQAVAAGLGCLATRGSLAQLRLYDRPAILRLTDNAGTAHDVVLTGVDGTRALLALGDGVQAVSIAELTNAWFGDFIMLWRSPAGVTPLARGARGTRVAALRRALLQVAGQNQTAVVSPVFDAALQRMVQDFQRRQRLATDGVAGVQTLITLDAVLQPPETPRLRSAPSQ